MTVELTPGEQTIRETIKSKLFEVEQAGRHTPAADHLKGLTNAAHKLQELVGQHAQLDATFGPRGPHHMLPEDVRRIRKDERRAELETEANTALSVLPGSVRSARAALVEAALPSGRPPSDREALVRDEAALGLSHVKRDAGDSALADAMLDVVRESGYDSDEARLLTSSWGRRFCRARGQEPAYAEFRRAVLRLAADHGDPQQKAAAGALRAFDEANVPGRLAAALQVVYRDLGMLDGGRTTRAFLAGD